MKHRIYVLALSLALTVSQTAICSQPVTVAVQSNDDGYIQRSNEAGNLCNQARNLSNAHNDDQALTLYERACMLDPNRNSAFAHAALGIALAQFGKVDEGIAELEKALQYDPHSMFACSGLSSVLCNKGNQLVHLRKYDEAEPLFKRAIALAPNLPSQLANIHSNYGALLIKAGRDEEALIQQKMALELNPQDETALYNIACCYQNLGDRQQSMNYFTKYLNDYPTGRCRDRVLIELAGLNRPAEKLLDDNKDSADYLRNIIAGKAQTWPKNKMPIRVFIPSEGHIPGFRESFRKILIAGFNEWASVANNFLSWKLVSNEKEADIVCSWTADKKDLGMPSSIEQGCAQTQLAAIESGKFIISRARLKVCIVDVISGHPLSDEVLMNVSLHEIGHVLGLMGHSPNRNDIMFSRYREENSADRLSVRDIATINGLYAKYQHN